MELRKWAPWNWFRKEQQVEQANLPVHRRNPSPPAPVEGAAAGGHPILQLQREIDRLFDQVFRGFGLGPTLLPSLNEPDLWQGMLRPSLDIQEHEDRYEVSLELPGVDPDDVQITLEDEVLVIRGEKRREESHRNGRQHRIERVYGSFQRMLDLPLDADPEQIKASFRHGVLTVRIGKRATPASRGRLIPVEKA